MVHHRLWLLFLLSILLMPDQSARAAWHHKLDAGLWHTAVSQPQTEFIIRLSAQADLRAASALPDKAARGRWVYAQLTAVAQQTQPTVTAVLKTAGADYKPFWVANLIWVRGDADLLAQIAQRPDVIRLHANPGVTLNLPPAPTRQPQAPAAVNAIEWNVAKVNAPYAWSQGVTGQDVVIGGQDTGYQWDHPALKNAYRGWNAATQTADHNYHWHDAFEDNPCGFSQPAPCDDNGHGTHTMGTMIGDDGGGNQIGVAPGARWIGCRNMDSGVGSPTSYIACYQWFLAPTDLNGENPRPDLAPHIINNSWYCPPSEGCTEPDVLLEVVQNVRAAGILTVHSAGNSGPNCGTIEAPAGNYAESFTVGNVTSSDTIATSSSRGPATFGDITYPYLKPNIVAPGTSVRSAYRSDSYATLSGTSMAGPHVAGAAALLISAQPTLAGNVDLLEQVLQETAVPLTTTQGCGGDTPTSVPNHTYGYGRVDALRALLYFGNRTYLPVAIRAQTQ